MSLRSATFRIAAVAAWLAVAPAAQGNRPATAGEDEAAARRPFCRLVEHDGGGQLEVMVATYRKGDATLTLFGALHVADRAYYEALQRRFAECDALLYELVGDADLRPYPGMEIDEEEESWISVVQGGMGGGLGLAAQFECLDYRPDNFVHADMTGEQWAAALEAAGKSELGELVSGPMPEPDREQEAKQRPLDLVAAFRSGRGIAELRLVVARTLAEPDAPRDEPGVVIEARNERCLEVLDRELRSGKQRLGIFYGAAHMEHLERRLTEDLGWRRTGEEWIEAWDCRYASFPTVEKGSKQKRYRARRDLQQLEQAMHAWRAAHPDEAPSLDALRAAAEGGRLPGRDDGVDPWGRPYVLRPVGGGYELRCVGADGVVDTEDDVVANG